jgi:zinc/manganese transport system permease protein
MEIFQFLLAPFVASLILTGIHAYLGVHVVERGVIFVDLALAQIAALGATIAILVGMDPHGGSAYWISLGFTFLGAGIFALARTRRAHIPQEAFIGITYAVASAAAILAMSKATGETEHLKDMLVGNILAVSWGEVRKTALLYAAIGLFHYFFRKRFLLISIDPRAAEGQGISIRLWDFLFYASFGFVVTSSVAIAGVLLVFCYLIVPSVGAMLFADRIGRRLAIGWTMGTLVSALGVFLSVQLDLPTGATIVCTFGGVLLLMFLVHLLFFHGARARELEGARAALVERAPNRGPGAEGEPAASGPSTPRGFKPTA